MTEAPKAPNAVEATSLSKRFGERLALDRVDLGLAAGESLALFGANGAGKTTLLRVLTLAVRADGGSFRIAGLDPRREARKIRRRIGLVSHQPLLYAELTARQNLELFGSLYGVLQPERRASELLDRLELAHRADDPLVELSRGMCQRVSVARALVHDPPILFLDEPFSGLDRRAVAVLADLLGALRRAGRTLVVVTHDLALGTALADRWVVLARGRVAARGNSGEGDPAAALA